MSDHPHSRLEAFARKVDKRGHDEWDLVYKASYNKPTCKNCQDPKPGKIVPVTIERTKHRGDVWRCAECGREITSGGPA